MAWASGQVVGALAGGGVAERRRATPCRASRSPRCSSSPPPTRYRAALAATAAAAGGRASARLTDGRAWRNWAGDQSCRPAEMVRPRDRDELAAAVVAAAEAGRTVSVAGSGHSFTEAAMTDGTMIDVEALSGVIDADPASGLVRVGAGTVLADLNEELARLGLAMENLGDIDRQTIAGAISTGTHGTGAEAAQHLRPGRGDRAGPRRRQRPRARRGAEPDLLRAARVGVGALGAISAVTLRCVPAFTLAPGRLAAARARRCSTRFDERADANDHFELFTFPYADSALVLRAQPHRRPPARAAGSSRFLNDVVLENWALGDLGPEVPRKGPLGDPEDGPVLDPVHEPGRADRRLPPLLRQLAPDDPVQRDGVRAAA